MLAIKGTAIEGDVAVSLELYKVLFSWFAMFNNCIVADWCYQISSNSCEKIQGMFWMQLRVQSQYLCQKSDWREIYCRSGKWMNSSFFPLYNCNYCINEQPDVLAKSIIQQFSPNRSDCKLTLGNDRLRYYHVIFVVSKDSPYQEQMRKEYIQFVLYAIATII